MKNKQPKLYHRGIKSYLLPFIVKGSPSNLHSEQNASAVPCWNHFPPYMQWRASVSGLDMPRSCSFHHQKPLAAARYSPALDVTKPSRSLEKVCDPYIALPGVKQVKTLLLKGCRNSSAICPPFLLPAHNLDARGLTPAGRLLEVLTAVTCPPRRTRMSLIHRHDSKNLHRASAKAILAPFLVEIRISRVQTSFFCYTAAAEKINWIMWRRKY